MATDPMVAELTELRTKLEIAEADSDFDERVVPR
jgi:hypothetical protein